MVRKLAVMGVIGLGLVGALPASAQDAVRLYHAGSLGNAWKDMTEAFTKDTGIKVALTSGGSGTLREKIEAGEKAELFTSADMGHPVKLNKDGKSGPVIQFTSNTLCYTTRPDVGLTPANFVEKMLDPATKIGTSTPGSDPSGDYTWEIFKKADKVTPGAFAKLDAKAIKVSGAPTPHAWAAQVPQGRNATGYYLKKKMIDLSFGYCSGSEGVKKDLPSSISLPVPGPLATGAEYGLTVLKGARPEAYVLAMYILSPAGQKILTKHGFGAVTLSNGATD